MIAPLSHTNGARPMRGATVRTLRDIIRRNRWIMLVLPLLTLAATIAFVQIATPIYESSTRLRIESQRSGLAVLEALQELSTGSDINTELAELRTSTSLAEGVVDALDLNVELREPKRGERGALFTDLSADRSSAQEPYVMQRTGPSTFALTGNGISRVIRVGEPVNLGGLGFTLAPAANGLDRIVVRLRRFPQAVRLYQRTVKASRPDREATILRIVYEGPDRGLVQAVPNEVARQFMARRDSVRKTQARSTVAFLNEQIDTLGLQLLAAERGLLAFRQGQHVISPQTESEVQVRTLAQFKADRDLLEAERSSLASLMSRIETGDNASYRALAGFPRLLGSAATSEMLRSLNELENKRAELLRNRTPQDNEVLLLTERIRQLDDGLKRLAATYLAGMQNQIASLDEMLAGSVGELAAIPAKEIHMARLKRQALSTEEVFTALQTRLKEAQIAAAVVDPSVRVVDAAGLPFEPIRPNKPLAVALAIVLGFALAVGTAFAREQLDNTIRGREDLLELSGNIPVLGQVPRIVHAGATRRAWGVFAAKQNGGEGFTAIRTVAAEGGGAVAEAYRTLRTNISFSQTDLPAKVLVITSAMPGEGKTTSSCNLALSLAQQGLRVLLIDADLRRGSLNALLGTPVEPGLSNVLIGRAGIDTAIQPVEFEGVRFAFLPTGTPPPNPAELLGSVRTPVLLDELRLLFDAIVIDSPPLNLVTDAAILGSRADGVLLVARAGVTERDAYQHALQQLDAVHARVLGCVLNDVDPRGNGYYGRAGADAYYGTSRTVAR
jgi:capsular exopolysaccharide synthesis family protein